jgi:hypothetical protein
LRGLGRVRRLHGNEPLQSEAEAAECGFGGCEKWKQVCIVALPTNKSAPQSIVPAQTGWGCRITQW